MTRSCRTTHATRRWATALVAAAVLLAARTAFAACEPTPPNAQGPFYVPDAPFVQRLAGPDEPGQRVELAGRVLALPDCRPVVGAVLDLWQASAGGVYYNIGTKARPADYRLRGRVRTGPDGAFRVETVRPGRYGSGPGNPRPSHIHVTVSAAGMSPLTTQVYFPGDPDNAGDDLFLPGLVGALQPRGGAPALLGFDFVLVPAAGAR